MYGYEVFGVRLDSYLPIPELEPACSGCGDAWQFRHASGDFPGRPCRLLGVETVYGDVRVHAYFTGDALQLVFDDTGTFEIREHARTITWFAGVASTPAAVRADLLGRVMALALHASGRLALHASAVSIDGRGIALLGQKGAGKSTLALALVQRGARLITDDSLILRFEGRRLVASPGVQRLRLWEDSARALGMATAAASGAKPAVDALPVHLRQLGDVPLDACYVLRPQPSLAGLPVRERLSAVHSAMACIGFSKLGALAGGTEGVALLDRCSRLADAIPVYSVDIPRDFSRMDATVATVMGWHAAGLPPHVPNVAVTR